MSELGQRIAEIRDRIEGAIARSGRAPGAVLLVAVTKTFPAATVVEAVREGLTVFGENRVQEAASKIPEVARLGRGGAEDAEGGSALAQPAASETAGPRLSWHLIGHLQSNKAKIAAPLFDLVHSVDDVELARRLDAAAEAHGKLLSVLVQVNVSGEASKSGVEPERLRELVDTVASLGSLDLRGLMTIPPWDLDADTARPHFAALRELGGKLGGWLGRPGCACELSMGMTDDFEVAIEEGATIVRIGRALFGDRPPR